ncbi:hypothetical protein W97_08195 [Coniosporium apollinis CBS 100218]|uniref:Uncharacterized protein n=1 Tax=Coniosporium apollinis (strain CBS 100218) TaxID=1168221 RepID=R7Z442_CONA1|nr:uncharacterized protein W97_08195 [Coniosporium apollinis CBS 100218]EON68937.1 hypothetical protein W97_08195 [Coniosporium apollinis CBS 100218]
MYTALCRKRLRGLVDCCYYHRNIYRCRDYQELLPELIYPTHGRSAAREGKRNQESDVNWVVIPAPYDKDGDYAVRQRGSREDRRLIKEALGELVRAKQSRQRGAGQVEQKGVLVDHNRASKRKQNLECGEPSQGGSSQRDIQSSIYSINGRESAAQIASRLNGEQGDGEEEAWGDLKAARAESGEGRQTKRQKVADGKEEKGHVRGESQKDIPDVNVGDCEGSGPGGDVPKSNGSDSESNHEKDHSSGDEDVGTEEVLRYPTDSEAEEDDREESDQSDDDDKSTETDSSDESSEDSEGDEASHEEPKSPALRFPSPQTPPPKPRVRLGLPSRKPPTSATSPRRTAKVLSLSRSPIAKRPIRSRSAPLSRITTHSPFTRHPDSPPTPYTATFPLSPFPPASFHHLNPLPPHLRHFCRAKTPLSAKLNRLPPTRCGRGPFSPLWPATAPTPRVAPCVWVPRAGQERPYTAGPALRAQVLRTTPVGRRPLGLRTSTADEPENGVGRLEGLPSKSPGCTAGGPEGEEVLGSLESPYGSGISPTEVVGWKGGRRTGFSPMGNYVRFLEPRSPGKSAWSPKLRDVDETRALVLE